MQFPCVEIRRREWEAIRSGLAAATNLTKLDVLVGVRIGMWQEEWGHEDVDVVEASSSLSGLTLQLDLSN